MSRCTRQPVRPRELASFEGVAHARDSRLTLKSQDAIALGDSYIATVSHWEQTYSRDDGSKAISEFLATEILWVREGNTLYAVDHASPGQ